MTPSDDGTATPDRAEGSGPLRIAMISYYLPSESKMGVGYQAHELADALVSRGHRVDMLSACAPVVGARYGHRRVQLRGALRTFRFALAVRRFDFAGYDVVHAHGDDYWLWRRRARVHVRTMHGVGFEEARRISGVKEKARMILLGLTELLASVVADVTVAVSPQTRRWMPWVREVIPNGVDGSRFRPDRAAKAAVPTVLFVGTWRNRKRGAGLTAAFHASVLPDLPEARLELVSRDAPDDPGAGVVVLHELSDAELVRAYQRAWVFCLPSTYEGFGIPYVEAMAAGLPVVATPNVGARYVTRDGRDGVLTSFEDLGPVLLRLLRDAEARSRWAERSLIRARDFEISTVCERYERLYRG